jgi:hypothetical protein
MHLQSPSAKARGKPGKTICDVTDASGRTSPEKTTENKKALNNQGFK